MTKLLRVQSLNQKIYKLFGKKFLSVIWKLSYVGMLEQNIKYAVCEALLSLI